MSTTATPADGLVTIDTDRPGIPFTRLVSVELRKMFDTLAGRWLMISTAILIALFMGGVVLVAALVDDFSITSSDLSQIMVIPVSLVLPVFAIIIVTSEWGQRSHLTLFTLEPHRGRIILAKLVAVLLLALATIVLAIIFGALGNVLANGVAGSEVVWNLEVGELLWTVGLQIAYFLMAFGLALVLLNTPGAIVLFYVFGLIAPFMIYSPLVFAFDWAREILPWIDFNLAATPLAYGRDLLGEPTSVDFIDWARFVVSIVLWVVLPCAVGYLRATRSEVK